jgi:hypothetical protein
LSARFPGDTSRQESKRLNGANKYLLHFAKNQSLPAHRLPVTDDLQHGVLLHGEPAQPLKGNIGSIIAIWSVPVPILCGTYNHMAVSWTWAFDTPFKWTKQMASHFGGTRQGMCMAWPNQIKDAGGIRHQFHHVIDVVPTILEATELPALPSFLRQPMTAEPTSSTPSRRRSFGKRVALVVAAALLAYLSFAYLILPAVWKRYAHRHPSLEDIPGITHTAADIPGDPLNVALIGTKAEVIRIMLAAKWHPADPLTLRSCLEMADAAVFKRSYEDAPVSNLYLFGRKEDLAFEQQVGPDPRHRHHVRFWQTDKVDEDGRPVWVGSAVYDKGVGLSHTTGQITHDTAANVDAERDYLFQCLQETGDLTERYMVDGFHKVREGRNGGGDPWYTDGNLYVGVIKLANPSSNP